MSRLWLALHNTVFESPAACSVSEPETEWPRNAGPLIRT